MGGIGPVGAIGGPEQQYALKWNDFHSSILSSFRHLRDQEDFIDVTIACDGCSFTAHKVVLSACSPYFRSLLKANPCQHPIVILRDVRVQDMEALLRFMYNGEVHIGQEQLPDFLKTAQTLQVRGLTDVNNKDKLSNSHPWSNKLHSTRHGSSVSSDGQPPSKKSRNTDHKNSRYSESPTSHANNDENLDGTQPHGEGSQSTPGSNQLKTASEPSSQIHSSNEDSNSYDEGSDAEGTDNRPNSVTDIVLQPKLEPPDFSDRSRGDSMMYDSPRQRSNSYASGLFNIQGLTAGLIPGPSGVHNNSQEGFGSGNSAGGIAEPKPVCRECGRVYSSINNLKQHVANVHSTTYHWEPCPICGKHFKTRQYLFNHLLQTHGIRQRGSRMPYPPNNAAGPPPPVTSASAPSTPSSHNLNSPQSQSMPSPLAPSSRNSSHNMSIHPSSTQPSIHSSSSQAPIHSSSQPPIHSSSQPPIHSSSQPPIHPSSSQPSTHHVPSTHASSSSSSHSQTSAPLPPPMVSLPPSSHTNSHSSHMAAVVAASPVVQPIPTHHNTPLHPPPSPHLAFSHPPQPPPAHPFSHIHSHSPSHHPHVHHSPIVSSISQSMHLLNSPVARISSGFHSPLISSTTNLNSAHSTMEANSERDMPHHAAVVAHSQKERELTSAVEQCLQFLSSAPK